MEKFPQNCHPFCGEIALTSQANSSLCGSSTHLPRKGPNLVPAATYDSKVTNWNWNTFLKKMLKENQKKVKIECIQE